MPENGNRIAADRTALARLAWAGLEREGLEAIAEAAITLLDEMSDPDEDRCEAGDDGCGLFVGGDRRGAFWGSADEGWTDLAPPPAYGIDQREVLRPGGRVWRVD